MKRINNKWTLEKCREISLTCKTKKEFINKNNLAYVAAINNSWLKDICTHMVCGRIRKWNKDSIKNEALKYKNKTDFKKNSSSAYGFAYRNGILDDVCQHMEKMGNRFYRKIYVFEFDDNHAYVGLTYNIEKRYKSHNLSGTVFDYINKTNVKYNFKILTEFLPTKEAIKKEEEYYNKYKENGWIMLNKTKTGAIGTSNKKWTLDICKKLVIECNYDYNLFRKTYKNPFRIARESKWLEILFMVEQLPKKKRKWVFNDFFEEVKKYNSIQEIEKNDISLYKALIRNKLLTKTFNIKNNLSKEEYSKICYQYKNVKDLKKEKPEIYYIIKENNWINEFFIKHKKSGYWTEEKIFNEAIKYRTAQQFRISYGGAFTAAIRLGILNKLIYSPKKIELTKEDCSKLVQKYRFPSSLKSNIRAYNTIIKNGWFLEFFPNYSQPLEIINN
jgi:predicted GIY-YIG superfamily endonuclease